MKRTGMRLTAVAAVTALLLGGCGEQPYSLTEDEEGMIVDYSAHAVAKFNTSQPDGLANVSRNEQETEAVDESQTTETENKITLDASGNAAAGDQSTENKTAEPSTLDELFGGENLSVTYTGAEIAANYMEGGYYSLDAEQGKTFVIVGIDITNELSFSKPSVSVAMKNLRENGYIHMDDQGHITLTQTGQDIADKMYERHIMLSNWLIYLGVDEKTAVEDACKIEHVLSSQSLQAIKKHITQGNELPADMKEEE